MRTRPCRPRPLAASDPHGYLRGFMNFSNVVFFRLRTLAFLTILGQLPASGLGQGPAPAKSSTDLIAGARALVVEQFAPKVPGLVVAAGRDGKIIWSESFGMADLETKEPVTARTLFRIGSVSKPLTAAGLMLLVENRQLDLDCDIRKYVPAFPDKGQPITTRQLAGHLAGIRHYNGTEFLMNKARHF
jgi:serine beta-lactamase-like protein LACTB